MIYQQTLMRTENVHGKNPGFWSQYVNRGTIRYKNTFIRGLYLLSHHDHVYLLLFTPVLKAVNKDENVENENLVSVEEVITHDVLIQSVESWDQCDLADITSAHRRCPPVTPGVTGAVRQSHLFCT